MAARTSAPAAAPANRSRCFMSNPIVALVAWPSAAPSLLELALTRVPSARGQAGRPALLVRQSLRCAPCRAAPNQKRRAVCVTLHPRKRLPGRGWISLLLIPAGRLSIEQPLPLGRGSVTTWKHEVSILSRARQQAVLRAFQQALRLDM